MVDAVRSPAPPQRSARTGQAAPTLQTVGRATDVLLAFSEERDEWGVTEIADAFDWSTSTAQRVLAALASSGFLWADPDTRRYRLGPSVWRLAGLLERGGGLRRIMRTPLQGLAARTGASASFSAPSDAVYVRCAASAPGRLGPRRSDSLDGELYPAHSCATARAYFAHMPEHVRARTLYARPMARFSTATEVDRARLERSFATTVDDGYIVTRGEWDASTIAIAAPVRLRNRVVGSVTAAYHAESVRPGAVDDAVSAVLETASLLGSVLDRRGGARRVEARQPSLASARNALA